MINKERFEGIERYGIKIVPDWEEKYWYDDLEDGWWWQGMTRNRFAMRNTGRQCERNKLRRERD